MVRVYVERDFARLLSEAVEEAMGAHLGNFAKEAIYRRLGELHITRVEANTDPELLDRGLRQLLGDGRLALERRILDILYSRVGLPPLKFPLNREYAEYVQEAKRVSDLLFTVE